MGSKVIMAMSGGVDSSAAAVMLKEQGYDVCGATMHLFDNETVGIENSRTCCSLSDTEDARNVCFKIGIPHYVFNYKEPFKQEVIRRFIEAYEKGETPNPCIDCNKYLKFRQLHRRRKELGYDYIATGHYAIREACGDSFILKKGTDITKDQSYVLYSITQEQLAHTLFPLGRLTKKEVRALAEKYGLANARKRESQDICFVPDGDYAGFIENCSGRKCVPGDFIDAKGNIIGRHKGIINYTIGQRKGLGLSAGHPVFVCKKDPVKNTVTVGESGDLFSDTLFAGDINFISGKGFDKPTRVLAKIRYGAMEQPATAEQTGENEIMVRFDKPQRAISPGQAVVLYDGDVVLGGGTIK